MRIRVGTAGLPRLAQGKSYLRGLKMLRQLGLDLLEIEFVRGVTLSEREAEEVGKLACRLDVMLTIHAPYYVNFCSEKVSVREQSYERVKTCLHYSKILNARYVVVHAGYYMSYGPSRCKRIIVEYMRRLAKYIDEEDVPARIAVETMGKDEQFGALDEIIDVCTEVGIGYVVPCIDWAHIYLRNRGHIDYIQVLSLVRSRLPDLRELHMHFTGLTLDRGKLDDQHDVIDTDRPPLRPLAEALYLFRDQFNEVSIVCESPLLERDALKIKRVISEVFSCRDSLGKA